MKFSNAEFKEVMIEALEDAQVAFRALDSNKLKAVSDYTLHYAGIFQDSYSISIAVVMYSLAKIVDRRKLRGYKQWEMFVKEVAKQLRDAEMAMSKDDNEKYLASIKEIMAEIGKLEVQFGEFVTEVIRKAKIKKGTAIYRHGLSVGRVAELMGVMPWELMDYIGQTKLMDETQLLTITPSERMKEARIIFNLTK